MLYQFLSWQAAPWKDTSDVVLLTGTAGGGKSHLAYMKAISYAMKYPGALIGLIRKNRTSMNNSVVPFVKSLLPPEFAEKAWKRSYHRFELPNGSVIMCCGLADPNQRNHLRGVRNKNSGGFDLVVIDEANSLLPEDYNEVQGRMRGTSAPWCQIMVLTNPDSPEHWIYKRLIEGGEAKIYYSRYDENYHNPESYKKSLESISGVQGLRLREGLWVRAEGAVIPEFDRARHIVSRDFIPRAWRKIRAIDFGFRAPFVCLWIAIDPETDYRYIYRELYQTELLVQDAAAMINEASRGEEIEVTVCDHDPENYGQLERYGISTIPAFKEIIPGIDHLKTLFSQNKIYYCANALIKEDTALSKIYLPTSLVQEIPLYTYAKNTEGTALKEIPVKKNDHAIDTVRYGMNYLDNIGAEQYGSLEDVMAINSGPQPSYKQMGYRI